MISALPLLVAMVLASSHVAPIDLTDTTASRFACGGRSLLVRFGTVNTDSVAIVDAGDGPHLLKAGPWNAQLEQLRWSDGARTLTWSAGVKLMWMDGANYLMCERIGGHHHLHCFEFTPVSRFCWPARLKASTEIAPPWNE
jgi:hypothetical protein